MLWYDYINLIFLLIIWLIIFLYGKTIFTARKYWLLFMAIYTIAEIMSVLSAVKGENNLVVYNLRNPVQFLFLIAYFNNILNIGKRRKYISILAALVICIALTVSKSPKEYGSVDELVYGAVIMILCSFFFYTIIKAVNYINLTLSEFWYCSSIFILFGVNLCINGPMAYLIKNDRPMAGKLLYGIIFNSYIFYGLVIYALLSGNYLKKEKVNG